MSLQSKVFAQALGCKINQCEVEKLKDLLARRVVDSGVNLCRIVVVNTCCVTNRSEYESRQAVRRAVKEFPDAVLIVTGCAAQRSPSSFSSIRGVDYVLGNHNKMSVTEIDIQKQSLPIERVFRMEGEIFLEPQDVHTMRERTRAFVKIQDGCDHSCSYCIVPKVRGRSRSVDEERVVFEISKLVADGFKEVVLSGIHLGRYGFDLSKPKNLSSLLRKIVDLNGNFRIRLSSIESEEISDKLIEVLKDSKVCSHLHIPLQSGDDSVLQRMNRRYTTENFSKVLEKVLMVNDKMSIGTDVIVGFPGEGEKEFSQTYNFLGKHPFSYFHVFRYSSKQGTKAADMSLQVPAEIKKERSLVLRELGEKKSMHFKRRFVGATMSALILAQTNENGVLRGLTDNYIHLPVFGEGLMPNEIIPVRIEEKQGFVGIAESLGEVIKEE